MVVVCRTQQLLNTSKNVSFSRTIQLSKNGSAFGLRNLFDKNNTQLKSHQKLRLCDCRNFHSSKEPRSSLAKLSPLELLFPNISDGFHYPDCEFTGMSCLDCYTRKQCLGSIFWSQTKCANDVTGHANPYCNPATNECTSIKPEGCSPISPINCLREGAIPDTGDCTIYHVCENSTSEQFSCPKNFVYKQEFGKCVFKLTDTDCVEVDSCGLIDYSEPYPGDPSLYYGCKASKSYLNACSLSAAYNVTTGTCENICKEVGLLPIKQNCMKYINCEETEDGLVGVEESCEDGHGFNPSRLTCEESYLTLCNELAVLENDIYNFISKIPIVRKFEHLIRKIWNLLGINPAKIFFIFRLSNEDISTIILISDYVYNNKRLPPSTKSVLVNIIIDRLPSQVRFIFDILSQLGIINVSNTRRLSRSINEKSVEDYLENVLFDTDIDLIGIIESFQGKNSSEITADMFKKITETLSIPEEQIPLLVTTLKNNLFNIANQLNNDIGWPIFVWDKDVLKIDSEILDHALNDLLNLVGSVLHPNDNDLVGAFVMTAKNEYFLHHDEIIEFFDNFYFSLDFK